MPTNTITDLITLTQTNFITATLTNWVTQTNSITAASDPSLWATWASVMIALVAIIVSSRLIYRQVATM